MKFLSFLGKEVVLGTLIALLSIFTTLASLQGSVADGKQNEYEILGMKSLNDGNAEYLRANQDITQDYNYFDNWYLNLDERPDVAEYYQGSFSQALLDAMDRDPDTVWDDQYYNDIYADADANFDDSDVYFETAGEWNNRGDGLQIVLSIMALGLAFAAWASLLKEDSNMRVLFALFAVIALVIGVINYLGLPVITA
ncbi:MAG TPA: hypothetical protein VFD54_01685 [Anaerolineales bacterium]|nr:hypothetical protein [Anaerolineales bacterium]